MKPEKEILFEEKQYLGYNKLSIIRRLLLALFCFAVYWWKKHNGLNGDMFFWLGVVLLAVSLLLLFVLHLKITVYNHCIVLDGLWTTRKVKIEINRIVGIRQKKYSKYHLNNPVFNLHRRGTVRFYTGGTDAVELTDSDGLHYRIGTHRPAELEKILIDISKNLP